MPKDLTLDSDNVDSGFDGGPTADPSEAQDRLQLEAGLVKLRDMPAQEPLLELIETLKTLSPPAAERIEIEALELIVRTFHSHDHAHAFLLKARDLLARASDLHALMAQAAAWRAMYWLQRQFKLHHAALHSLAHAQALYERCAQPALALRMETARLSLFFAAEMFLELRQASVDLLARPLKLPPRLKDGVLSNAASAAYFLATEEPDEARAQAYWEECLSCQQAALEHALAEQLPSSLIHLNTAVVCASLGRIEACLEHLQHIDAAYLDQAMVPGWRWWLRHCQALLHWHQAPGPEAWDGLLQLADELAEQHLESSGQLQATLHWIARLGEKNGKLPDALQAQRSLLTLQRRLRRELASTLDQVVHEVMEQPLLKHQNERLTEHGNALEKSLAERNAELSSTLAKLQSEMSIRRAAEMALQQSHDELEVQVQQRSAELNQAMKALMHKEKQLALSRLVSGVAHEMNTPLDNARMAASALVSRSTEVQDALSNATLRRSQLQELLAALGQAGELIDGSLERMGQLVQRFKTLASQQVGEERSALDLTQLLKMLASTWQRRLDALGVPLQLDLPDRLLTQGYPETLRQVLQQLLDNSLTHGLSAVSNPWIRVRLHTEPNAITLIWQDNGRGIAPEHLPHVFEPFYTTQLGRSGTGLGLASVHTMVVELMQGQVLIDSTPGQGTTVSLRLPRDHS